eukprot:3659353-Prymnesium_polylepis.1
MSSISPRHANRPPPGTYRFNPARTKHVPVIDIQRDVNALSVGDLEEVARVEIRLGEALDVHELIHRCAVPNAPGVGLAVQGHLEAPNERHAAVVEDAIYREPPGKFGGGRA